MTTGLCVFLILEGVMSAAAFLLYGIDKSRAKRGKRRIRERTLLLCALFFGAPGALLGIFLLRHKTRHWYFVFTAFAGLLLQLAAAYAVFLFCP